jgi:hypothetical protein
LLSKRIFTGSIWISLPNPTIWVLSDPSTIREENILLSVGELYGFDSILLDSLDSPVWEYTLLLAISENALNSPVREAKEG